MKDQTSFYLENTRAATARCAARPGVALLLAFALAVTLLLAGAASLSPVFAAGTTHYIAVGSDRHSTTDAISIAMAGMPDSVEYVCLNGDMVNAESTSSSSSGSSKARSQQAYNTSTILAEVQAVFPALDASSVSIVYGSHDANATDDAGIMDCADRSLLPSETGSDVAAISQGRSGLIYTGYEGGDVVYFVYGVSYYDMIHPNDSEDEPEAGGKLSAEAFRAFADEHPDVPIIVIGHVPIHALRGDNLAASYWNAALNYAATGSDAGTEVKRSVAYIHGHNHTVEETEYFVEPGGTLTVQGVEKDQSEEQTIRYTYVTSGYLRDNHTSTLIGVKDNSLSFTKYHGCVVEFDPAGGSETTSQAVCEGRKLSAPAVPVRAGYDFTGWDTEAACENLWKIGSDKVTEDMTLYAGWVKGVIPGTPTISCSVKASSRKAVLTKKSMKNAKVIDVSSSKTAYTIKKLAKGRKYYVSVRPLRKSGSTTYYGSYSKAKSIKTK